MTTDYNVIKNEQLGLFPNENQDVNKTFRPIHYLGSKLRMLDFICKTIDEIDPTKGRVCDLFSGSGTVSHYLSMYRPVTSIDIQEYSRVITSSMLNNYDEKEDADSIISHCENSRHFQILYHCIEPMIKYEKKAINKARNGEIYPLCELVEMGSIITFEQEGNKQASIELTEVLIETVKRLNESDFISGPEALVSRYFGGLYFSYEQAVQLDSLLEYSHTLKDANKDFLIATTLSTASEIVNTVGKQFAQPLKTLDKNGNPKGNLVRKILKDRSFNSFEIFKNKKKLYLSINKTNYSHESYRMDYLEALDNLKGDVTVVYADPPYTRYHYSRYYHVLETMSLRDNPVVSKNKVNGIEKMSRAIYREERHQSNFSIMSKAEEAFRRLFEKISEKNIVLVLSYSPFEIKKESTPRVQTIEGLTQLAQIYFDKVEVRSPGAFSHSKLNHSDKNFDTNYEAEKLIICSNVYKEGEERNE